MKKQKTLLTDSQRRELIDIFPHCSNEELCDLFRITPLQLSQQLTRLGLSRRKGS